MVASCSKLSLFPLVLPFIGIVSLNAQNIEYCTTPTISSLNEWKSDLRQSSLGASLPPAGTASCSFPKDNQKVLFLGVDGFRAASAAMLPLPNIRRLESMGVFSYWASTQQTGITKSGPGWTSMLTGVEPTKHGVDANYDLSDISSLYPTFLKVAKEDLGKSVAASVVWSPLIDDLINVEDPATLDKSSIKSTDASMASEAKKWIENENYDVIFTDFDGCDAAGHANDFDGYDDEYRAAAIKVDTLIGSLLDAVENRPTINGEEWLFVLTSDHGGEGNSHGSKNPYNRRIPLIVASNSPRVGMGRASSHDPGSHLDVFPTIIHFLGGDLPLDYLDGQVFGFRDYERTPPPQPPACISDPSSCGCKDQNQADYRGTVSTTKAGNTCQRWDSQTPNMHDRTAKNYPDSGLEDNYCRNPDNEAGAWCYTIDGPRWELCDIPACPVSTTNEPTMESTMEHTMEPTSAPVPILSNPAIYIRRIKFRKNLKSKGTKVIHIITMYFVNEDLEQISGVDVEIGYESTSQGSGVVKGKSSIRTGNTILTIPIVPVSETIIVKMNDVSREGYTYRDEKNYRDANDCPAFSDECPTFELTAQSIIRINARKN